MSEMRFGYFCYRQLSNMTEKIGLKKSSLNDNSLQSTEMIKYGQAYIKKNINTWKRSVYFIQISLAATF